MCSNPNCKKVSEGEKRGIQLFCDKCLELPFEKRFDIAVKFLNEPKSLAKLNSRKQ